MSHHTTNIEEEETFAPIYANQEDFNPNDTVSSFLNTSYDPTRLHPLAGLGGGLDYLNLEDNEGLPGTQNGIVPSRGWSDDLTYGTGVAYITGKHLSLFRKERRRKGEACRRKADFICAEQGFCTKRPIRKSMG